MIKLHFSTIDGIRKTKSFKTLAGARKAAHGWVGKDADVGSYYAVSTDGVVKVTVDGATLDDIFGDPKTKKPEHWWTVTNGDKWYATAEEANDASESLFEAGYYVVVEEWKLDEEGIERRVPPPVVAPGSEEIPF